MNLDEPCAKLWLKALRRQDPASGKDWAPGDGARVCSDHFIEGKSDDSNSHDYIPSVNLGYQTPLRQLDRYNRTNKRSVQKATKRQLEFQSSNREEAAVALLDLLEYQPQIEEKENKVKSN